MLRFPLSFHWWSGVKGIRMWSHRPLLRLLTKPTPILSPGADLGGGCRGCALRPPPPHDPRFSNTTCILPKKNYVVYWCWSRARDECNPLLKKILDPPLIPEYICHGSPKLELTSSKRHIKTFHVVVMQGRQRNVPKRVLNLCMHPKLM